MCLGIESTAHTFGAAVAVDEEEEAGRKPKGSAETVRLYESGVTLPEQRVESRKKKFTILSDAKDVYRAPEGSGIHPREASRHHALTASSVVETALSQAGTSLRDIDCIAYSAGPGLGPCLRIGAVIGRTLSSYYQKPLVPTNHAIGHIELGKLLTGLNDPLVLLISGGHTALVARRPEGWRIFGETLDITLGQLLDQLGRSFGLSSPAGPTIEKLAKEAEERTTVRDDTSVNGKKVTPILKLPYTVKGNDVSYSGILSAAKDLYSGKQEKMDEISYAVQEYAFSMLVEVTERALAFTDNRELLVTGGVAANQRLSSMLGDMCRERGVELGVIPRQYAGDCGSQIAAAGMYFYKRGIRVEPSEAFVRQSWRIDRVDFTTLRPTSEDNPRSLVGPSQDSRPKIGAEAVLNFVDWHGEPAMSKHRIPKNYRAQQLDQVLRSKRTKQEAEMLHTAKFTGVDCPYIFLVDPNQSEIIMEYVEGRLLRDISMPTRQMAELYRVLGEYAARLHSRGIMHGDLTTKNVIQRSGGKLCLIDFGLSFRSERLEDRAEDIHLLKQAIKSSYEARSAVLLFSGVIRGYQNIAGQEKTERLLEQIRKIEDRGRYARVD
ncbi:MAG TPA: bifunctional N(6)-L-threonylcarbamoyladenine synthase/serine/threonine protein kinase [Nitrososphaerales archaeon]|nr:bifunctional N(6)-L-threonylcarbamoyladenine synthase/serine/threonine protein kinase [Nitrososphaerales archaeon]